MPVLEYTQARDPVLMPGSPTRELGSIEARPGIGSPVLNPGFIEVGSKTTSDLEPHVGTRSSMLGPERWSIEAGLGTPMLVPNS